MASRSRKAVEKTMASDAYKQLKKAPTKRKKVKLSQGKGRQPGKTATQTLMDNTKTHPIKRP